MLSSDISMDLPYTGLWSITIIIFSAGIFSQNFELIGSEV